MRSDLGYRPWITGQPGTGSRPAGHWVAGQPGTESHPENPGTGEARASVAPHRSHRPPRAPGSHGRGVIVLVDVSKTGCIPRLARARRRGWPAMRHRSSSSSTSTSTTNAIGVSRVSPAQTTQADQHQQRQHRLHQPSARVASMLALGVALATSSTTPSEDHAVASSGASACTDQTQKSPSGCDGLGLSVHRWWLGGVSAVDRWAPRFDRRPTGQPRPRTADRLAACPLPCTGGS